MTMFQQELKNNIKDELIKDDAQHNILNILIKRSININNNLYEWHMKEKHDENHRTSRNLC